MEYTTCYCRSPQCPMYGQVAPRAQVKRHDWQRQGPRFRCERCGGIVSATTGTAYAGIRTDLTTYLRGATALAEGLSIRATGRLLGVDKDPANRWLPVLGQHGQRVMNACFRNLHLHECQLDELWTFIHKKEDHLTSLEKLAEVSGGCVGLDCLQPGVHSGARLGGRETHLAPCAPPAFSAAIGDRWTYPVLYQ
jgi:transposase-like protein